MARGTNPAGLPDVTLPASLKHTREAAGRRVPGNAGVSSPVHSAARAGGAGGTQLQGTGRVGNPPYDRVASEAWAVATAGSADQGFFPFDLFVLFEPDLEGHVGVGG